jgi:phytanoyl-CoA hydroxylase
MGGLTGAEIAQWNEQGYCICRGALLPEDLAPMVADYEQIVDGLATRLHAEGRIRSTYASEPFDKRYARITAEDPSVSDGHLDEFLDIGHATARGQTRGTFELMRCSRLMDLIAPILGTEEIGWSPISHVRAKLPANEASGAVLSNVAGWHQDAIFVTEDADNIFVLTVWLPVTEATVEMGCLEIMPGTHHDRQVYWSDGGGGSMGSSLPRRPTFHEPVSPGDVVLLHNLCPHGSGPNLTDKIRWSMDMRYTVAGLPSGRDCWPAFTAQSRLDPSSETDYDAWVEQWREALERFPQRAPRAPECAYNGPVPYTGPMAFVDPSLAMAAAETPARRASVERRVARDDVGPAIPRAKF